MNYPLARLCFPVLFCAYSLTIAQYYPREPVPQFILERLGPFGPQEKSYPAPAGAIFVAPNGVATASGNTLENPTTLPAAISNAKTGDVIVLRGGNYHAGDMSFSTKITIQAYLNEKPVIKGSSVAGNWTKDGAAWFTMWNTLFKIPEPNWYLASFGPRCYWWGDMVFINGASRIPVENRNELVTGKFYIDYAAKRVYVAEDPAGKSIEITDLRNGFIRRHGAGADAEGPTFLGLVIMDFAEHAIDIQGDMPNVLIPIGKLPNAPVKTRIENCRLLYCGLEALMAVAPESYIGYSDISMTTYCGIKINTAHNSILEHNILHGNNTYGNRGYPSAAKIFMQSFNYVVRNNLVENNDADAIWFDVGHHDGKIYGNYFRNNSSGMKLEISHRTFVANNVFENNGQGIYIMTQADAEIYNNTFINSHLEFGRDNREIDFHASTGPGPRNYHGHKVANNVFTGAAPGYVWFTDDNNLDTNFQTSLFAQNLFLKEGPYTFDAAFPHRGWARTHYTTLADFTARYGGYESGCVQLAATSSALYRNRSIGDYRLNALPGMPEGLAVPDTLAAMLGWESLKCLGAFAQPVNPNAITRGKPAQGPAGERPAPDALIKAYKANGAVIKKLNAGKSEGLYRNGGFASPDPKH